MRVVERGDDVLFEGIVAERLAHDDIDPLGRGHVRRVHLGNAAVGEAVVAQQLACDVGDLGRLVEIHPLGPELRRQEAEETGPCADVGHRRLALDDDLRERRLEGRVANAVGEQRAMVFDAHWKVRQ